MSHKEALHKQNQSEENWKNLVKARADFNLDQSNYIKQQSMYLKQQIHEFGNRPGKPLAHYLKKEQARRTIMAIKIENEVTYDPLEINNHFFKFYSGLYKSENVSSSEATVFLDRLDLPQVTDLDQQNYK